MTGIVIIKIMKAVIVRNIFSKNNKNSNAYKEINCINSWWLYILMQSHVKGCADY